MFGPNTLLKKIIGQCITKCPISEYVGFADDTAVASTIETDENKESNEKPEHSTATLTGIIQKRSHGDQKINSNSGISSNYDQKKSQIKRKRTQNGSSTLHFLNNFSYHLKKIRQIVTFQLIYIATSMAGPSNQSATEPSQKSGSNGRSAKERNRSTSELLAKRIAKKKNYKRTEGMSCYHFCRQYFGISHRFSTTKKFSFPFF